ncbi:unnamed protein product [Knipowitschia caucasica]
MVHKYDTDRAVCLLRQYQANLIHPEEQTLKTSVDKVSAVLGSQLFKALLESGGLRHTDNLHLLFFTPVITRSPCAYDSVDYTSAPVSRKKKNKYSGVL